MFSFLPVPKRLEATVGIMLGVCGATLSKLFGEWTDGMTVLLILIVLDIVAGVVRSISQGQLASDISRKGIAKKVLMGVMVAAACMVDQVMHSGSHVVRDLVLFFYITTELLSITENAAACGLPMPEAWREWLKKMNSGKFSKKSDG